MRQQFPYDHELHGGDTVPLLGDFEKLLRAKLREWIDYLKTDPPLEDLRSNAERIMELVQIASGLPGAEQEATELALAVDLKFERLGLWRAWYKRLMALYSPVAGHPEPETQARLYQCLMHYYLRRGDMTRANAVINSLLDLLEIKPDAPLQEIRLAQGIVAIEMAKLGDDVSPIQQLVELAWASQDARLLAQTYCLMARYYAIRMEPYPTFQFGQMVYSIGIAHHLDTFILDGLNYMAIAFQVSSQPRRALHYLELAMQYSYWTEDAGQMQYAWHTYGVCCYHLGDYGQAAYFLRVALHRFEGYGHPYAVALLTYGLALMRLEIFEQAERAMNAALNEWVALKRPADQLSAEHALAHLYWLSGRDCEAVERAEAALRSANALGERLTSLFVDTLRADLAKYRASCNDSDYNRC